MGGIVCRPRERVSDRAIVGIWQQENMRKASLNVDSLKLVMPISTLDALHRHLPKLVNVP